MRAALLDDAPDQELDQGFGVAVVEERSAHGEQWGRTRRGLWLAMRELAPVRPLAFHGEEISSGMLDFGWIIADRAAVYSTVKADKAIGAHVKWDVVRWREEVATLSGRMVRISEDGAPAAEWMRARDVVKPTSAPPPDEIGGAGTDERWIDVELASQTLVAWEGTRPVFATVVSTGKGPPKSDTATPPGVHRLWVKLVTTPMDNLEKADIEEHARYSIEDVPYVQFFDKGVALHGAFWHRNFGRTQSHGCVNLAPLDARWLFAWTAPHVPPGWSAAFPTRLEPGTTVRVR
jgi:hypothetical protein